MPQQDFWHCSRPHIQLLPSQLFHEPPTILSNIFLFSLNDPVILSLATEDQEQYIHIPSSWNSTARNWSEVHKYASIEWVKSWYSHIMHFYAVVIVIQIYMIKNFFCADQEPLQNKLTVREQCVWYDFICVSLIVTDWYRYMKRFHKTLSGKKHQKNLKGGYFGGGIRNTLIFHVIFPLECFVMFVNYYH